MNTPVSHPAAPRHHGTPPCHPRPERHRHQHGLPLTDDQYVATSLSLVADLSRRVRLGGAHRHG